MSIKVSISFLDEELLIGDAFLFAIRFGDTFLFAIRMILT